MPAARIICPGCKTVITSAQAIEPGKVVDCPKCQLLFVPTSADLAFTAPSTSPFPPRRRPIQKANRIGTGGARWIGLDHSGRHSAAVPISSTGLPIRRRSHRQPRHCRRPYR